MDIRGLAGWCFTLLGVLVLGVTVIVVVGSWIAVLAAGPIVALLAEVTRR